MPRFTHVDFLAATSSTTTATKARRPQPNLTIRVPQAGKLRLPVAPPSPLWEGANDVDTEPFPEFVDICPPTQDPPTHCLHHCSHRVCSRLAKRWRGAPPCRCSEEICQPELAIDTPRSLPKIPDLKDADLDDIRRDGSQTPPDQKITIDDREATQLISRLEILLTNRAVTNEGEAFMEAVQEHFPCDTDRLQKTALGLIETFFNLVTLYLDRTMAESRRCTISVQQLRTELMVYAWTGFDGWMIMFCSPHTRQLVRANIEHPAGLLEGANFRAPGVVAMLWLGLLDEVVTTLVWRDQYQARQSGLQGWLSGDEGGGGLCRGHRSVAWACGW